MSRQDLQMFLVEVFMKKSIFTMSLCFPIILFLSPIETQRTFAQTEIPAGNVSGTWTQANSPYNINGEITIPNDSTLTIEPGVEVIFTGHYKFYVYGNLLAIGTEQDSIKFTSAEPDSGWHGIKLVDIPTSNDSTIFEYCTFQYGKELYGNGGSNFGSGGAIYSEIDKLRISHCLFRNNSCFSMEPFSGAGGAVAIEGNPIIEYCVFRWNESLINGAAIWIFGSSSNALIRNNHFHHNIGSAPIGIYHSASPKFINNLIEQNYSNGEYIIFFSNDGGNTKIINNTIVNNTCSLGAVLVNDGLALFVNNIVYGNEPSQVYFDLPSTVSFYNCLIEGGQEGFTGAAFTGTYENCIDADPQFVSSNDYHLQNNSPCIGAGYYEEGLIPPYDYEGNPRPNPEGSMPDIGAYENELQNPAVISEWLSYNTANSDLPSNTITCIEIDEFGNKWIGTGGGLVKFDGTNWTVYNSSNSGLPDNWIPALAIDRSVKKLIGTGEFTKRTSSGLAKFDGTNWIVYDTSNSSLPGNWISAITIDGSGNKWIGIKDEGLAKFDGSNWILYNSSNSGLPKNIGVRAIAIDGSGNKWIGAYDDFVKFDDTTWTVYNAQTTIGCITIDNTGKKWIGGLRSEPFGWFGLIRYDDETFTYYAESDSGVPLGSIQCIAVDEFDNKWIGTYRSNNGGLVKFDGTNWTDYSTSNSGLPDNWGVNAIAIDGSGNIWIGTWGGGLAVYNEGGVVSVEENPTLREIIPNEYLLYQNYPNPFNPSTTIKYSIPKLNFVTIKIYDVLGSEVATLINEEKSGGNYELSWSAANLPSGVYFYQLKAGSYVEIKKMILLK